MASPDLNRTLRVDVELPANRLLLAEALREGATRVRAARWRPDSQEGFNVVVAEPAKGFLETAIFPMSFDYRIDPLVTRRLQVLAATTGWRFAGVETPGVTMDIDNPERTKKSSVRTLDLLRAMRGNFGPLVHAQFSAVTGVLGEELSGVRLVGESLGAQMVSAMAASGLGEPASVDLIEPVNAVRLGPSAFVRLARNLLGVETARKAEYLKENEAVGFGDVTAFELLSPENAVVDRRLKSWRHQWKYANLPILGLTRGLGPLLTNVQGVTPARIWRGAASEVCSERDCIDLAETIRAAGHPAQVLTLVDQARSVELGHHVLTSLPRLAQFAQLLRTGCDEPSPR
ncbi:hypothetical protein ACFVSU_12535 [Microbacterium sp. NPDC058062]|uniref:hypothetical protein n=1 Tax=Microbacterium sp. NPDC058062 TaxID=3346320 RepID=UPI0036DEA19F